MPKVFLFVILTGTCIFMAALAQARVSALTVAVDGLACPFCAYGVEKKLKKVAGVNTLVIDMKGGTVTLTAQSGQSINFSQVPGAVRDSGFTPRAMKIVADGTITPGGGQQFQLNIDGQSLQLIDTKKIATQLRAAAQNGKPVTMQGILHEQKRGGWTLSPESLVLEVVP